MTQVIDQIGDVDNIALVWHRRNLRTQDHPGIAYATREYDSIFPIFIFDPSFYTTDGLACDARIRFLHECLADLADQYDAIGGALTFFHEDPTDLLPELDNLVDEIITTADPTGRYGLQRDNAIAETCDISFVDDDGLKRDVEDTRENWDEHVESWLTDNQHTFNATSTKVLDTPTEVTPNKIADHYSLSPDKSITRTGGTTHARKLLTEFSKHIAAYPSNISAPQDARSGTSQLSPYLRFGCLSVRQVYQEIIEETGHERAKEMFISRLYWNRHYQQKLADWSGWMDTAVNPLLENFHDDTYDPEFVEAWKQGDTGYPMVDASMRCLKNTGWLNFRMRAMCASFLCDLLQQPWKIGADYFYYHLLDADPAINYTQFQLQAGVDGTNMMRIYNPRKQVRDNDPDGEFIKKWIPELSALPAEHLDRPEKTPLHIQKKVEISIGDDYPYPIVEYESARESIIDKFEAIKPQAKKALSHPEVRRRASLSQRGGTTTIEQVPDMDKLENESTANGQASLSDYR